MQAAALAHSLTRAPYNVQVRRLFTTCCFLILGGGGGGGGGWLLLGHVLLKLREDPAPMTHPLLVYLCGQWGGRTMMVDRTAALLTQ